VIGTANLKHQSRYFAATGGGVPYRAITVGVIAFGLATTAVFRIGLENVVDRLPEAERRTHWWKGRNQASQFD